MLSFLCQYLSVVMVPRLTNIIMYLHDNHDILFNRVAASLYTRTQSISRAPRLQL